VLALLLPLGTCGEIKDGITEPTIVNAAFLGSLVEEFVLAKIEIIDIAVVRYDQDPALLSHVQEHRRELIAEVLLEVLF
jgi:hypothetical protein